MIELFTIARMAVVESKIREPVVPVMRPAVAGTAAMVGELMRPTLTIVPGLAAMLAMTVMAMMLGELVWTVMRSGVAVLAAVMVMMGISFAVMTVAVMGELVPPGVVSAMAGRAVMVSMLVPGELMRAMMAVAMMVTRDLIASAMMPVMGVMSVVVAMTMPAMSVLSVRMLPVMAMAMTVVGMVRAVLAMMTRPVPVVGRMLTVVGFLLGAILFGRCAAIFLMRGGVSASELLPPLTTLLGADVRSARAMIARARRLAVSGIIGQSNLAGGGPIRCRSDTRLGGDSQCDGGIVRLCVNKSRRNGAAERAPEKRVP